MDDNGAMAVVMPHGVLFRGGAEGHIRQYLIEDCNYLDAVIGLPANIFYGTSIPTCILVFKKCRENPEDILFIDASQKYSYVAKISEIKENDFNLNIPRYVDTFEAQESIDLSEIVQKIKNIDCTMVEIDKKIAAFCKELNIESPF